LLKKGSGRNPMRFEGASKNEEVWQRSADSARSPDDTKKRQDKARSASAWTTAVG